MVSDIHRTIMKVREGSGRKDLSVSYSRTLAITELPTTAAQTQARSEI